MTDDDEPTTAPFSAAYTLVSDAEIIQWPQDEAIMDYGMYAALANAYHEPVVGYISGTHYEFRPCERIPALSVAVPEENHENPEALLIHK